MRNTKKRIKRNKRRTRKYSSSLTGGNNTSSVSSNTSSSLGSKKRGFFGRGLHKVAKRTGLTRKRSPPADERTVFDPNIVSEVTGDPLSSNDPKNNPRGTFDVPLMHMQNPVYPTHDEQTRNEGGGGGGLGGPEGIPLELQQNDDTRSSGSNNNVPNNVPFRTSSERGEDIQDLGKRKKIPRGTFQPQPPETTNSGRNRRIQY